MANLHQYFLGFARVELNHLRFSSGRRLNEKHVQHLHNVYQQFGCHHDDPIHSVPAVMNKDKLNAALCAQRISIASLPTSGHAPPRIDFDVHLDCLHGKHRITAAQQFLKSRDQWWIVQIYDEGIVPLLFFLDICLMEHRASKSRARAIAV